MLVRNFYAEGSKLVRNDISPSICPSWHKKGSPASERAPVQDVVHRRGPLRSTGCLLAGLAGATAAPRSIAGDDARHSTSKSQAEDARQRV